MDLDEAKEECWRWLGRLDRERQKTTDLAKLAADVRAGKCDEREKGRRLAEIDGLSPTVHDGGDLEKAVRVLLENLQ